MANHHRLGTASHLLVDCAFFLSLSYPVSATWKGEYAATPPAVQQWFKDAETTKEARKRLVFNKCCDKSDRFETQFKVNRTTGGDEWRFWDGSAWQVIPDDVIHDDEIHAKDPKDDALPEFQQMRREGVLFIYNGQPTCFWPPQGGI